MSCISIDTMCVNPFGHRIRFIAGALYITNDPSVALERNGRHRFGNDTKKKVQLLVEPFMVSEYWLKCLYDR